MDTIDGFWAGAAALAGRIDLDALAKRLGGWPALRRATADDLVRAGLSEVQAHDWLARRPMHTAGAALTRLCARYPAALRSVPRSPPVVFVEGDVAAFSRGSIGIVGTRACSPYGRDVAHRLAYACALAGLTVVSGLARGVDSAAHRGALAAKGRTVAVLGHGLAHTAPPSNVSLRRDLINGGGACLSPFPDDLPPARWTFPERNRWIAGLSRALIVVEAPERSGALITAERMVDLGRQDDLWVVPGPLGSPSWRGSSALLSMGAHALCDIDGFVTGITGTQDHVRETADWLSAVFTGAGLDEVAVMRGIPVLAVIEDLTRLELLGEVVRLPGGRYLPAGSAS